MEGGARCPNLYVRQCSIGGGEYGKLAKCMVGDRIDEKEVLSVEGEDDFLDQSCGPLPLLQV